jgi:hypothetical protein
VTPPAAKANLFIVGAMKCGTTAWYQYLRSHPDIFMPDLKEPGYFATDVPNWRLVQSQEEYSKLFEDSGTARVIGEASTVYLMSEKAANAIRDYNADAKILIFLRDQQDYLPSLHNENLVGFGEDITDFERAWRLSGRRPAVPQALDYAAMGRFHEQVSRYLDVFPAEQVRVVWFRDWVADPRSTYLGILKFLGLEDDGRTDFPRVNQGLSFRSPRLINLLYRPPASVRRIARLFKRVTGLQSGTQEKLVERSVRLLSARGYKNRISPELADEIRRHFADDNRRLNELLGSTGALLKIADPS